MCCANIVSETVAGNEYKAPTDPICYHQKQCPFGPANTNIQVTFPRIKSLTTSAPDLRSNKPGAGLGWTEPRVESFLGLVDRRLHLHGYVGGVKKRDSKFVDK